MRRLFSAPLRAGFLRAVVRALFAVLACICLKATAFATSQFTPIPAMTIANAVSADGSIVVGDGSSQAVMWTQSQGVQPIASTPAFWDGSGVDITRDGQTVLANYPCFACSFGFPVGPRPPSGQAIWTQSTGLTFTQPYDTSVRAFAADNHTLLGQYFGKPAYWTPGQGWTQLGMLPTIYNGSGIATASSADNSTIIGYCTDGSLNNYPFRWTAQTGIQPFSLPAGYQYGSAWSISDDGSIVAGVVEANSFSQVFRWTEQSGMQLLGNSYTRPVMSADGSTIVWTSSAPSTAGISNFTQQAYIWDAEHGVRFLQTVLEQAGADVSGYELNFVQDISPDGRTLVGRATLARTDAAPAHSVAFIATLAVPEPSAAALVACGVMGFCWLAGRRPSLGSCRSGMALC